MNLTSPGSISRNLLDCAVYRAITVIVHHLGHRCSHASRYTPLYCCRINWTFSVKRIPLPPITSEHRGNSGWIGSSLGCVADGCAVFSLVLNILGIAVEPGLEVAGQVVEVDGTFIGVAEDGIGAVVTAGDDIALVVADVEDVIRLGFVRLGSTHGSVTQRCHGNALATLFHESKGILLGLLAGDGIGNGMKRGHDAAQ